MSIHRFDRESGGTSFAGPRQRVRRRKKKKDGKRKKMHGQAVMRKGLTGGTRGGSVLLSRYRVAVSNSIDDRV